MAPHLGADASTAHQQSQISGQLKRPEWSIKMSFQIRYYRDGLPATSYTAYAQTMFEARRLARIPQIEFCYDLAVIVTLDKNSCYQTIDILRRDPEHRSVNR
jgi:hypothetical protein